jgi:surface antigen
VRALAAFLFAKKHNKQNSLMITFAFALLITSVLQMIPMRLALAGTDDYPTQWRNAAMDSTFDSLGYYNRECTSFVAWRLNNRQNFNVSGASRAMNWGSWATSKGYSVDMNPAAGSVAWWGTGMGHVAWVESVNPTGNVTVEEYNGMDSNGNGMYGDDGTYSERTIAKNAPSGYIHFKDLAPVSPGSGVAGFSFLGSERLNSGQILRVGQYIVSPDVQYALVMQGDGNLVIYGNGFKPLWASNTSASGANFVVMQGDGNLVLYTSSYRAIWSSGTAGRGQSFLNMQDDGNLVLYNSSMQPTWSSGTPNHMVYSYFGTSGLYTNQTMGRCSYVKSSDGRYALLLLPDGNLELYGPGNHIIWTSGSGGQAGAFIVMQGDGNLVIYRSNRTPVWASGTNGYSSSNSIVQGDGNFVIYNPSMIPLWASGTGGKI